MNVHELHTFSGALLLPHGQQHCATWAATILLFATWAATILTLCLPLCCFAAFSTCKLIALPCHCCRHSRTVRSQEDRFYSGDDDGGEFWLSPRIACMLHQAGCVYIDVHCDEMQLQEDLPACVQPYAQQEEWQEAYRQAAMRLVARLEKGLPPHPNCTGVCV